MENNYEQNIQQKESLPDLSAIRAEEEVRSVVGSAFGKGLAAAIMCEIPVASIIAIFMGNNAASLAQQAEQLAAQYGISAGGKCTAAKVLGKVGKFAGIGFTIFWVLYFGFFFLYFFLIAMLGMAY